MVKTLAVPSQQLSINDSLMFSERNIYICHAMQGHPVFSEFSIKWVDAFIDYLSVFLKRISKSNYNIAYSGVKNINLEETIKKSSVFIFILNEDSSQSTVFNDEVKLIQKRCWDQENNAFLYKILASPIKENSQVSFFSGMSGSNFFDAEAYVRRPSELRKSEWIFTSKIILEQLADLAYKIDKFFEVLSESEFKTAVYLAETTPDQFNNREMIKREMEHYGYRVLPERELPDGLDEFTKTVEECIKQSDFSIHIIGQEYGEIPVGEVHSKVDIQNKIAADIAKNQNVRLSRLIWISSDLKIINDLQNKYVERLKNENEGLFHTEIIQTPLEDFKSLVLKRLMTYHTAVKDQKKDQIQVYIIHEPADLNKIAPIVKFLNANNIQTIQSPLSQNNINLISKHRQNLIDSEAVLIYNSNQNQSWLQSKILDCVKAPGYGKKQSFIAKAVIMAQPSKDFNINQWSDFVLIADHKNIAEALQPLLDKLIKDNE